MKKSFSFGAVLSVLVNRCVTRNAGEVREVYDLLAHITTHQSDLAGHRIDTAVSLAESELKRQIPALEKVNTDSIHEYLSYQLKGFVTTEDRERVIRFLLKREAQRMKIDENQSFELESSEMVVNPPREATVA